MVGTVLVKDHFLMIGSRGSVSTLHLNLIRLFLNHAPIHRDAPAHQQSTGPDMFTIPELVRSVRGVKDGVEIDWKEVYNMLSTPPQTGAPRIDNAGAFENLCAPDSSESRERLHQWLQSPREIVAGEILVAVVPSITPLSIDNT
jgi:hypothetical protein